MLKGQQSRGGGNIRCKKMEKELWIIQQEEKYLAKNGATKVKTKMF